MRTAGTYHNLHLLDPDRLVYRENTLSPRKLCCRPHNDAVTRHVNENDEKPQEPPAPPRPVRLPRPRWAAALAAATLAAGVAIGAAIGPAPAASLAGDVPSLAKELPLLIAGIE